MAWRIMSKDGIGSTTGPNKKMEIQGTENGTILYIRFLYVFSLEFFIGMVLVPESDQIDLEPKKPKYKMKI